MAIIKTLPATKAFYIKNSRMTGESSNGYCYISLLVLDSVCWKIGGLINLMKSVHIKNTNNRPVTIPCHGNDEQCSILAFKTI